MVDQVSRPGDELMDFLGITVLLLAIVPIVFVTVLIGAGVRVLRRLYHALR